MTDFKILDIDFSVPYADFVKRFEDFLSNYVNQSMYVSCVEQGTRNGKYMYKFNITCNADPNETTILFEKDLATGDVKCVPSGFNSFGGTFYKQENYTDATDEYDDTFLGTIRFLEKEALTAKGDLVVLLENNKSICIKNGQSITTKTCLVDSKGNVYGAKEIKSTDISEKMDLQVHYDTYLGPWIKEQKAEDINFEMAMTDKTTSMAQKMYYIGKYLVKLRQNEEIEGDMFRDLFKQSAALDQFVTDNVLHMIYKMIN